MKKRNLLLMLLLAIGLPWAAVAQQALPYSYGFENNDLSADGWTLSGSTSTSTGIKTDAKRSGTYGFRFHYSERNAYLMSPILTGATTGLDVGFYYKNYSSTYPEKFQVGYTTDETITNPASFTYGNEISGGNDWAKYENTFPANTKRVAIKYVYTDAYYLYLDDFTFVAAAPCPKPTGLTCTTYTATTATLGWTENGTATNWVLEYGTASDFTGATSVTVSGTPTNELTGLTAETTYYARVKADCDGGDQSEWSNVCEFKPSAALIIGDGTSTTGYAPLYGNYNNSYDQMIYTASQLGLEAAEITKIGFNSSAANSNARTITIYMGHTTKSSFSSNSDFISINDLTVVYSGTWNIAAGWNEFSLTTPFDYDGSSNLVIALYSKGSYKSTTFYYTATSSDQVVYAYSDSNDPNPNTYEGNWGNFSSSYRGTTTQLPNLKLFAEVSSTPKPTNLTVSNITAESATVTWAAPSSATPSSYYYSHKKTTDASWPADTQTGNLTASLTNLDANTEYQVRVKADYGTTGQSDYAETTFTTEASCLPPTSVTCTGVTSTTATFTWNADGTECQYNLVAPGTPEANYGDGPYSRSGTVAQVTFGDGTPSGGAALTPNTEYLFVVRKWCGDTDYSTWETLTVRTDCGAVTSFPWSENFESYASGTFSDPCWVNEHISGDGTSLFSIYTSSNGSNSTHQLQLPDQSQGTLTKLVLPEMTLPNNNYEFIIDIYRSNSTWNAQSPNEGVRVYASTNGEIEGATELAFLSRQYNAEHGSIPAEAAVGWYTYKLPISISGTCYIILRGESQYCSSTYMDNFKVKEMVTVTANQIVANNPGENQMTWSQFAQHVNNGDHFTNPTITLMENISITEMVGTAENPYSGTFDGGGFTITATITSGEKAAAPFHYIKDATIQNLTMTGSVVETTTTSDGFHVGGLVGYISSGTNTIQNCHVSTDITITTLGGGIVGHANNATLNLIGCVYDGDINNTTPDTDGNRGVGGLVGWCGNNATLNLNSCVFDGTYGGDGASVLFHPVVCGTGNVNTSVGSRSTFTNVYYTHDQQGTDSGSVNVISNCGKHAYTITAESPVTVAMSGEYTEYDMSGIKAYASNYGLLYNNGIINGIIAGNGDNVSLILSNSSTGDYQADHGTLTANGETYTLAMTANDTEISESCNAPTNLRVPAQSINAHGASIAWDNPDGKLFEYCLTVGPDYTQTSWQETTEPGMQYAIYLENPLDQNTDYRFYLRKKCGENYYSAEVYVDFHTIAGNKAPTSLAYADVDAHTATITWSGVSTNYYHQSYDLYYSTDETMPQTPVQDNLIGGITTTSQGLTGLNGQTTYYVWVRDNCGDDGYSTWAGPISFTTAISCLAPTQFAASDITNHTATLSWQGASDSYTVQYRTAAGIVPIFSEGFENGIGNWSMVNCHSSSGINTSNHYSGNSCFYFYYRSNPPQYLVSPELTGVTEGMKLEFHYKNSSSSYPETFRIGTSTTAATTAEEIEASFTFGEEFTVSDQQWHLYSATIPAGTKYICWKLTSDNKFYLFVDDVKIGTEVAAGEWQNATVDGTTANLSGLIANRDYEATVQGDCGEVDGQSTVVSTTFTTDLPCPDPTNLQVVENSLKSDRVTLSWDSDYAEAWTVAFKAEGDADFSEQTASENPYTLQGLTEETTYTVKVRSNCGSADGLSTGWSNEVTFTTTEACVVMDVAVSDVTHYAATVTWTGDNKDEDNPGFTVSYRTAQQIDGVEESFDGSSIPWEIYSGQLQADGTATLSSASGWRITTYAFGNNNATCNIFGTNCFRWLVTPTVTLPQGSALNFDMALTDYGNSDVIETPTSQADDRFVVLVSTNGGANWTILREWNNAEGTTYVYNSIATTGEHVNIDLSAYNGQTVKIAFYGESTASGGDNDLHIDNVTIGTPVAAGTWQTVSAANDASSANLSGLTAGTKYDVKVAPNCDATLESEIVQFTTVSPNEKWFITEGNWGTTSNWEPVGAPTIEQNVTLMANATIESGCVAEAKSINGTGTSADNFTLTIKDGGKLKHLNSGVRATVEKAIRAYSTNYDADTYNNGDYYLIANPLTSAVTPSEANGFFAGKYDLYSWDYAQDLEWRNNVTSLMYGSYGYLYANEAGTTLTYTGEINAYTGYKYKTCSVASNPDGYNFPSWYLLGNPYLYDAYLANASSNGTALPYIKMNANGDGFENKAAGTPIPSMEGFFYQAVSGATSTYVVTTAPAVQSNSKLNMNLRRDNKQLDNAILVFGGDQQLGKMTFRPNSSKVFMPVEGKDYAITSVEGQVGEVPVSFVPENNGTYSLSFTSEEVSFSYLHLIDNMTGAEVDLLANPSYTFNANTSDYESRFRLVFATGSSTGSDTFGFVNASGNFCIFGIEGEATVQVIDVLGHVLSSEQFSGSYERKINGAPGVYMVRLIQGNDIRVQKMVVR